MATRRRREGLADYNPKRATAARFRKQSAGPKQQARQERRRAADERRREGRLPSPTNKRLGPDRKARLLWGATIGSWPAEAQHLHRQALADALRRPDAEGYGELWREYVNEHYRTRYNAQERGRRSEKRKAAAERSPFVWVKRHRRRRPGK